MRELTSIKIISLLILSAFALTLIYSCGGSNGNSFSSMREHAVHFRNGHIALTKGNYELAESEFKKAIDIYPDNAPYYNYLGLTYFLQKKYQTALKEFDKGLKINNAYGDIYNNRGLVYLELGEEELALEEFKKALKIPSYPTPENAYFNIGRIHYMKERWVEAEFNFEKALNSLEGKKRMQQPEILCYLSMSLMKQDKYSEALVHLKKAVKINPKYVLAHYNLGVVYYKLGVLSKAMNHFLEVRSITSINDPMYKEVTEYINRIKEADQD